jgi:hypothetical protein
MATAQFLWSYCHSTHGVYHPAPAEKVFAQTNVLSGQEANAGSKSEQAKAAGAAAAAPYVAALQQRLPQLASALKAALTASAIAEANALSTVSDAQQKAAAASAHAAATASAAATAAAAAAGQSMSGAVSHRQSIAASAKSTTGAAAASPTAAPATSKASAAAAAASSKLAASSEEAAAVAAAAAAAAAALPDQAVLAAVQAQLQAALATELALLQQRLSVLGHRANVLTEEVVQLHAAANSQMAEWAHRRYVDECGAVAALERVTKAAAAAGKPLAQDLRLEVGEEGFLQTARKLDSSTCQQGVNVTQAEELHAGSCNITLTCFSTCSTLSFKKGKHTPDVCVSQDEFLVVDSSLQLVPRAVEPAPPRPASPPLPPGVLSMEQLQSAAAAMQATEQPAGFLAVQSAAELLLGLASQGAG